MKKFLLYTLLFLAIFVTIFSYILYTEGVFEAKPAPSELKPFKMKCEVGKCAAGKCGNN